MTEVKSLPNVSKLNPYDSWDRGLFIIAGENGNSFAKISEAVLTTHGTALSPAVVTYSVQVYEREPKSTQDLNTIPFQTIGSFRCVVRNVIDDVNVIEAFAIRHYKQYNAEPVPAEAIQSALEQGERMVNHLSNVVESLETVINFGMVNGLLTRTSFTTAFRVNKDGTILSGSINEADGPIDPLNLVNAYIRQRAQLQ